MGALKRGFDNIKGAMQLSYFVEKARAQNAIASFSQKVAGTHLRAGTSVGKFTIEKQLGKGLTAESWLAQEHGTKHQVSVKVARRRAWNAAIGDEVSMHPNTKGSVKLVDAGGVHRKRRYIVQQYVPGETATKAELQLDQKVEVLRQVASAVARFNKKGLAHRDLNPHNVVVSKAEQRPLLTTVLDFGIAQKHKNSVRGRAKAAKSDARGIAHLAFQLFVGGSLLARRPPEVGLVRRLQIKAALFRAKLPNRGELARILEKGMEAGPKGYRTPEAFINDLERWHVEVTTQSRSDASPSQVVAVK